MGKRRSVATTKRIQEALGVLQQLGLPRQQLNERSALTLLSLLDLKPEESWAEARAPLMGITPMMEFFADHYGRQYAPNTRETVRHHTVRQFVQAGLAVPNPDKPSRPTNSPKAVYQIDPTALKLLRTFGTLEWPEHLTEYLASVDTLKRLYAEGKGGDPNSRYASERVPHNCHRAARTFSSRRYSRISARCSPRGAE